MIVRAIFKKMRSVERQDETALLFHSRFGRWMMVDDEEEIRTVIEMYVSGFNRGDTALLMQALHPYFISSGFVDGDPQWDNV